MSMNQIPTLVLGIGGIGCRIAATISDALSPEDKKYVAIVGIDTNINDLAQLRDKHEMVIIQTSDDMKVTDYLERHPSYNTWFTSNNFLRERTMTDGAGQIRMLSRLALLESMEQGKFDPILKEIKRIRRVDDNPYNKSLNIIVTGSITGGTGAGLFLSLPFYLRNLLKTQAGIKSCVIRGMFIGPDIVEEVQPSQTNKDAVCVNGYTCIKELTAFYLHARNQEVGKNLRLEFYDHNDAATTNVPYNYLYILENSGSLGTIGDAKIAEIIDYVGHILFLLMFSPVTGNAQSIEDNFIMSCIVQGGLNRYVGAGMCRLVYPLSTAREYVTLALTRELVQREWLYIDRKYTAFLKAQQDNKKTDPTVVIPELEKEYVEIFRKEVVGERPTLGMLAQEAFYEDEVENKYVSRGNLFIDAINSKVKKLIESDEVKAKEGECEIDDTKMKNLSDAAGQVANAWEGLRNFAKYVQHQIDTKPGSIANDVFPESKGVMEFQKEREECIYNYLAKVHPVTARFLIYDIICTLEQKIAGLEKTVKNRDVLDNYTNEDFDPKKKDVQGPSEVISEAQDKHGQIRSILGSFGSMICGDDKLLKRVKRRMHETCKKQVEATKTFMVNGVKYATYKIVLERLRKLAKNYKSFFDTIATKIQRNNDSIERLENITFPYGQDGLYCSKAAFRRMVEDFMNEQPVKLSENTKAAIFEHVFAIQAHAASSASSVESKAQKERRVQNEKRKLIRVFEDAVINTIRDTVAEDASGIVNLTAREALAKEFQLKDDILPDEDGYTEGLKEYVRKRIDTAFRIAAPMLTTEGKAEHTELLFLAVSPECSETDSDLKPDVGETARYYIRHSADDAITLINDEFDDTEITVVRIDYNHTVEDLTKYQPGARNAIAYNERISNLDKESSADAKSSEILVVVNPHLDSYWSEEAYVPSIYDKQRIADHDETLKAFVYGCGLDSFDIVNDDEHPDDNGNPRPTWYVYTNGFMAYGPIKKCGKLIGNGYHDVYDAIPYNRALKQALLSQAASTTEMMKGYKTSTELFEEILDNWFIVDLVQPADKVDEGDKNIFDIFAEMRSHIPEPEWNELFRGLLITLWEFLAKLFDNSEVTVNKAAKLILPEIYKNCATAKKPEADWKPADRALKNNYDELLKKRFQAK